MRALDPDVHTAADALREALDLGPIERPTVDYSDARRVEVRLRPSPEYPDRSWRTIVATPPGDTLGDVLVGRYGDQRTAVMRGITAARFLAAGLPWRAEL